MEEVQELAEAWGAQGAHNKAKKGGGVPMGEEVDVDVEVGATIA